MKRKKALVLTYHVKRCMRRGGFHEFISYLKDMSFDIDWVTCTMNSSWIVNRNDRENFRNFYELWKGLEFVEDNSHIRHFAIPVMLPARIAKHINKKLYNQYWPKWKWLRKKLADNYDVILVEGVACQYAEELKKNYPRTQIIYRPSDVLESFSNAKDPKKIEKKMIELADITYCVDENQIQYYLDFAEKKEKLRILRNPITTQADLDYIKTYVPSLEEKKSVIYVGVSNIDLEYIEYAAENNPDAEFLVIGPFENKSHNNIYYLGAMMPERFQNYLQRASVGINPMSEKVKDMTLPGYTKKIVNYMKYLMPIVATYSDNYLDVAGYLIAKDKEEFSELVSKALNYSIEERMALKKGYEKVLSFFLDTNVKEQLRKAIEEKVY